MLERRTAQTQLRKVKHASRGARQRQEIDESKQEVSTSEMIDCPISAPLHSLPECGIPTHEAKVGQTIACLQAFVVAHKVDAESNFRKARLQAKILGRVACKFHANLIMQERTRDDKVVEVQSLAAAAEQRHVEVLDGAVVVREHSGSPLQVSFGKQGTAIQRQHISMGKSPECGNTAVNTKRMKRLQAGKSRTKMARSEWKLLLQSVVNHRTRFLPA